MRLQILLAAALVLGCRPGPKPPPGGGDTVTVDSMPPDTVVATDSLFDPDDTLCFTCTVDTATPPIRTGLRRATLPPKGVAAGMMHYAPDQYCSGPLTSTLTVVTASAVLNRLKLFQACGIRGFLALARSRMTIDGTKTGRFSLSKSKTQVDEYAHVLTPEVLQQYKPWLQGILLMDEFTCAPCWGGRAVPFDEVQEYIAYAQQKLAGLPVALRVQPDKVTSYTRWSPGIIWWAQYNTNKGDQKRYYDKQVTALKKLPSAKLVLGLNVEDCHGSGTAPCTPSELTTKATLALSYPLSCAFIGWQYTPERWRTSGIRTAWANIVSIANRKSTRTCGG